MQKIVNVKTKNNEYNVIVGSNLVVELEKHLQDKAYSKIILLVDQNISNIYADLISQIRVKFSAEIITYYSSEENKTIAGIEQIWSQLLALHTDRKSVLINIGGGVLTDIGGFAAATFMRGIDFINCPTTLLSMVDASVGGKVGVNFQGVKNIIGSYQQPKAVIIDVNFLQGLPERELRSGMAEIIKHGLIASREYFDGVVRKKFSDFSPEEWQEIIYKSCEIKAKVVMSDESESGVRKTLNFGHTVGHAIEAISHENGKGQALLHGEAIAIGMIAESKISELTSRISAEEFAEIIGALERAGLPLNCKKSDFPLAEIYKYMQSDKKNFNGKIKWTLLNQIGAAEFDVEVDNTVVDQALKTILV